LYFILLFLFFNYFSQAAAGQEPNKEAYPAANRPNLVALVNGKSGGTSKAYRLLFFA
jgi:hypothetical protein